MVGDICRRYDMAFFDGLGRGRVVGFFKKKIKMWRKIGAS